MRQGQKEVISFVGPPGSGKGTVAQEWQKQDRVSVLSTGDLCRSHIKQQTEFGKEFAEHLAAGGLIPDQLISDMVADWLIKHQDRSDHMLLDGFPRTAPQAGLWAEMMAEHLPSFQMRVVLFTLPDEVIVDRLSQRVVCANESCQQVYGAAIKPASCVVCSSALMRRPDDEPDVIRRRLALYAEHEASVLKAYRELGIAIERFDVEHVALDDMFTQFNKLLNSTLSAV